MDDQNTATEASTGKQGERELDRRNILIGIGAIGLGSSFVGLGQAAPGHSNGRGKANDSKTESEFVSLFDSDSIEDSYWHQINGKAEYYVEDGTIVGESVYPSANSFLTSYEMFDDFELRMEVGRNPPEEPEPLNSGIQVRSNSSDERIEVHGPQAEIELTGNPIYGAPQAGRVWGESLGTGWMSSDEPTSVFDDTGWNDYRIRAEDKRLEVWVNDTKTADIDLNDFDDVEGLISTGFVGLQVHGVGGEDETGRTVRWRNIRIKKLDADEWTTLGPADWIRQRGRGSKPASPGSGSSNGNVVVNNGVSLLHSEESFDDFTFETWVKADAKGGILFRTAGEDEATGYRVDIDPTDSMLSGSLYDSGADEYLKHIVDDAPSEEASDHLQSAFHPDQWNYLRVKADGDNLRVWVNGVTTADLSSSAHSSGYLGLQHLGDGSTLKFKDMAIQSLDNE